MSAHVGGLRLLVVAVGLAGCFGGCHVPPAPDNAQRNPPPPDAASHAPNYDPYNGWLYKGVTGQKPPAAEADAAVRQTSAETPVAGQPPDVSGVVADVAAPGGPVAPPTPGYWSSATSAIPPVPAVHAKGKDKEPEAVETPTDDEDSAWSALYPSTIYKNLKVTFGYGPNQEIARKAFQDGQDLFRQKKYAEAASRFAVAVDRWPDTPLEEDAMFMLGESLFFSDQYARAEDAYEALLKKYRFSRYLDRVVAKQFAIGRFWEQADKVDPHWTVTPNFTDKTRPIFDTWGWALKAYEHVRMNDPTGPLADAALMASANSYFVNGHYEEAGYHYDLLRKEYPKSEFFLKASLLTMEAKERGYQGPMYDGTPLKKAIEVADQVLSRFGKTLGPEREKVIEAKNRFVEQMAEREWSYGQYYDHGSFYGAARYYYRSVIETYPQTQAAVAARKRMDEIKALPDEPPKHFKWLSDVFDSKRN
jgi:outer membrane protein assembly factor BamD (BamD/ComL family)